MAASSEEPAVLDRRALNRALLARQLLLRRHRMPAAKAVEQLVGLQAQEPRDPYVALWTRLAPFDPRSLSRLLEQRKVVRLGLLRSTIHLASARDALALRPVVQPVLERMFRGSPFRRNLDGMDRDALVAAGRALLEEQPLTNAALGKALQARWPGRDATSMGYALRTYAPLVQVPPRGLWGGSGAPKHTTAEHWLGRPLARDTAPDAMVLRYLRAFGPASVADAQAWSGLTRLKDAFERLRPRLRAFRDERGRELFDLPRAPRPAPDVPAPPRFLPMFDNVFLAHADRARIAGAGKPPPYPIEGAFWSPWLLDGFVAGAWRLEHIRGAATLTVTHDRPLRAPERAAVRREAAALLAFLAGDARRRTVRFAPR